MGSLRHTEAASIAVVTYYRRKEVRGGREGEEEERKMKHF